MGVRVIDCSMDGHRGFAIGKCHLRASSSLTRRSSSPLSRSQEELWTDLFSNPSEWWDNRWDKRTVLHPDFRHKSSREPLWLNSMHKPPWVDTRLASLDSRQQPHPQCAGIGHEIQALCEEGNLDMAFDVLSRMDQQGIVPSEIVYLSLLKACNKKKNLAHATRVHAHLAHHSLDVTSFIGDYLVVTLAKCGGLEDACHAFHRLPHRTVFSWTAIICAYSDCGKGQEALKMYQQMREEGVEPDKFTFASLLKACGSIPNVKEGRRIHADARRSGSASDAFVGSTLVTMYGKCGRIVEAELVFGGLSQRNIVSWNAMLSAYVEHGQGEKALQLYRQMQTECINPDQRTFVISLQACCTLARKEEAGFMESELTTAMALETGQALHADLWKKGFASDVYINNTLLSLYGKCGSIMEAENVFCGMSEHNSISWNEMLSAYIGQGQGEKALQLYRLMQEGNVSPDQWTIVVSLQACCMLADKEKSSMEEPCTELMSLEIGQALHADAKRKNLTSHVFVGNSLVSMYGKCGRLGDAENVFHVLSERDIVSWNAMLSAYVERAGQQEKALQLYIQMQEEGAMPDDITFVCILRACSETGSSDVCRLIHFIVLSTVYDGSPLLANTLIHAYGSCASMVDAQAVFDRLPKRDVVSWNALIAGYAQDGNCMASLQSFEKMQDAGVKPDGVTFLSLFFACSHAGFVDKGVEYFESMCKHGIAPEIKHFGSIIGLLGRAGDFKRLESMVWRMPMQPDLTLWLCLLGACQMHSNVKLAKQAFDCAVHLEPKEVPAYILMSNIYANNGLDKTVQNKWTTPDRK